MIKKMKLWWLNRKYKAPIIEVVAKTYTREQLVNAYKLGHNDGKREGLTIAREQASKSLKEILWQQNQKKNF